MKVYLVRVQGTYKIQGVFWARNAADLWDAVDEMGDPVVCEYAQMRRPSGIWQELSYEETPELPVDGSDDEIDRYFEAMKFTMTGELFPFRQDDQDSLDWKPFDSTFEGGGLIARIPSEFGKPKRTSQKAWDRPAKR